MHNGIKPGELKECAVVESSLTNIFLCPTSLKWIADMVGNQFPFKPEITQKIRKTSIGQHSQYN